VPLTLPASCATCQHFDGDLFCGLPKTLHQRNRVYPIVRSPLIPGTIPLPTRVVCDLHEPKTEADDDGA
jgi:hypothetical protein